VARAQAAAYGPRAATILLEHDLAPDFFYVAFQESEFKVDAVGPRTRFGIAKGMWQLIPGTAREYGLHTGPLVAVPRPDPLDERHDFEKSTAAAASYLRDLYTTDAQASGLLVMASYNWGQTRILRLLRSMPPSPKDRNYWTLLARYRDRIPDETYNYVISIVAAAVVDRDPALFGFRFAPLLPAVDDVAETDPVPAGE
jgi:peptidoglycan lytic transglycosylase D